MALIPFIIRLLPAIVWDIADFFLGVIPGVGHVMDVLAVGVAWVLYRNVAAAAINAWEIIEVSNALDMWVPTMTITGLLFGRR